MSPSLRQKVNLIRSGLASFSDMTRDDISSMTAAMGSVS